MQGKKPFGNNFLKALIGVQNERQKQLEKVKEEGAGAYAVEGGYRYDYPQIGELSRREQELRDQIRQNEYIIRNNIHDLYGDINQHRNPWSFK